MKNDVVANEADTNRWWYKSSNLQWRNQQRKNITKQTVALTM